MDKKWLEKEIKNITRQLIEKYKPEKIILFGSAARGEFGPDSDLDFLVIKNDKRRYLEIEQEVHWVINYQIASDFFWLKPYEAEYRLKHGDFFLKEIFEQGRVLYG
jgi:predicted nucleotidyltransferase